MARVAIHARCEIDFNIIETVSLLFLSNPLKSRK